MKVLITGAAGFLGRAFTHHYLSAGIETVAVDDLSSRGAQWLSGDYERHRVDVSDYFGREARNFDLAYHFAAPVGGRLKIEGDPLYNAGSLGLDTAFFRWAVDHVQTAVYPSSSAVYGTAFQEDAGVMLTENMADLGDQVWFRPDEMYGFTKMAGEVLASKAAQYGLDTLCIRPFSGYGEEQSLDYPMPSICRRVAMRENPVVIWGSGKQTRDFIHVSDIVGATLALVASGTDGYRAVNLGSGVATSFTEVAVIASQHVGYSPEFQTDDTKPEGVASRFSDPTLMLSVYQPKVSLEAGIARMVDRYTST